MVPAPRACRSGTRRGESRKRWQEARDSCSSVKQVVNGDQGLAWSNLEGPLEMAAAGKMSSYSSFLSGKKESFSWQIDWSLLGSGKALRETGGAASMEGVDPPASPALFGETGLGGGTTTGLQKKTMEENKLTSTANRRIKEFAPIGGPKGDDQYSKWADQLQTTKNMLAGDLPLRQCGLWKEEHNRGVIANLKSWLLARYRHSAALAVEFIEEVLQCESLLLLMRDMANVVEAYECGGKVTAADDFVVLHRKLADVSESLRAKKAKVGGVAGTSQKPAGVLCSKQVGVACTGHVEGKAKKMGVPDFRKASMRESRGRPHPLPNPTTNGSAAGGSQFVSRLTDILGDKGKKSGEMKLPARMGAKLNSRAVKGEKAVLTAALNGQAGSEMNYPKCSKKVQSRVTTSDPPNRTCRLRESEGAGAARRLTVGSDAGVCVPGTPCRSSEPPLASSEDSCTWRTCHPSPPVAAASLPSSRNCHGLHVKQHHPQTVVRRSQVSEKSKDTGPPTDLLGLCDSFLVRAEEWFMGRLRLDYCDHRISKSENREECRKRMVAIQKAQRWLDQVQGRKTESEGLEELRLLLRGAVQRRDPIKCELPCDESSVNER